MAPHDRTARSHRTSLYAESRTRHIALAIQSETRESEGSDMRFPYEHTYGTFPAAEVDEATCLTWGQEIPLTYVEE